MPFGLKMSQDVFQSKIDQLIEGCVGTTGIADDMIANAETGEEPSPRMPHTIAEIFTHAHLRDFNNRNSWARRS